MEKLIKNDYEVSVKKLNEISQQDMENCLYIIAYEKLSQEIDKANDQLKQIRERIMNSNLIGLSIEEMNLKAKITNTPETEIEEVIAEFDKDKAIELLGDRYNECFITKKVKKIKKGCQRITITKLNKGLENGK